VGSVTEFPERFNKLASCVERKPDLSFVHADFRNIDKFVADMVTVYNAAWASFKKDYTPLDPVKVKETFEEAKVVLDEELVWYAYHKGKPIAFYIIFPDLNQILRHFNGKLNLWNLIRFYYYKQKHEMTRMRAIIAGIDPAFQNTGIESVIFKKLFEVYRKKTYYKELELSWVGDFNPKMISIYKALGAKHAKTHITYRYLFDKNQPFIRFKDEMEIKTE
jgi:GNAT superfamily N-acetyltransferase